MKLKPIIESLEQDLQNLAPADCPAILGELERLRAMLWTRMMTTPATTKGSHRDDQNSYTIPEVAQRLKISAYRGYELARQGKLPHQKIGKLVRVTAAQLAEFECRTNGTK
jgi:excisionase family DNA binding protein